MEQKIKVEVTPAANDQWPKGSSIYSDIPIGTRFIVQLSYVSPNRVTLYLLRDGTMWNVQDRSINQFPMIGPGQRICFSDFEMAAEWWLNPQPVKTEPEMVKFGDLDLTDTFLHEGTLFHVSMIASGSDNGTAISFEAPFASSFASTDLVTPFKGTVTISVE